MKIRDIVKYNGKDWKIIGIKGDWARIKKVDKGHIQKIVPVSELEEVIKWKMFLGQVTRFKRGKLIWGRRKNH